MQRPDVEGEWKPISEAPYRKVLWGRNSLTKDDPFLFTRGWVTGGMVHEDDTLCTTSFTPDPNFPTKAGDMCCPSEWHEVLPEQSQ